MLAPDEIARIDREFLRSQERDRMNERSQQMWPIFISLATGFGVIALQSSELAYLVLLFPVLICCLSEHIRNSEDTLRQIRKYLYRQEQVVSYEGYEHFTRDPKNVRASRGGYKSALRHAFLITQVLAVALAGFRLYHDQIAALVIVMVIVGEMAVIARTGFLLRHKRQHDVHNGATV